MDVYLGDHVMRVSVCVAVEMAEDVAGYLCLIDMACRMRLRRFVRAAMIYAHAFR